MDRQQFISYIKEPEKLDKNTLPDIEILTSKFPYCQSLQILHLLNLKMINHVMYSEQLKSTAAHIADRKRLRELIKSMQSEEEQGTKNEQGSTSKEKQATNIDVEENDQTTSHSEFRTPHSDPIVPVIEQDEEARLLRLKEIVENRLKEIAGEKADVPDEPSLSKDELIEKFMRDEPSISRPKKDFFDPVKVARDSQEEHSGMVTETLARIHIQQGNFDKAIEIYRKLSLNFPEKSAYFAAQIKKLRTEN